MTLIDAERLQELLVEYYDRLDQDTKSLVPLRRLFFP
jgi:predicted Mrr-cat superfamily restriction endonuclease